MHWQTKTKIMKICALLSARETIYRIIQKVFGRLKVNLMARVPAQVEMARLLLEMGKDCG